MPAPASAAIASDIGHGALGLRDALRPFSELVQVSAAQRHCWVELRGARVVTGWVAYNASSTYVATVSDSWDGVRRDVVGVKTSLETLTRVDSIAACVATPGTYFRDFGYPIGSWAWDDGVTLWDAAGVKWDPDPTVSLYIHTSSYSPNEVDVVAQMGVFVGTHGVWQPTFAQNKLTDGSLETWTSSSVLTNWTTTTIGGGGGTLAQDATAPPPDRTYSAKISGTIAASGGTGILQGSMAGIGGALYRLCGWYRTLATNASGIEARLRVGASGAYLLVDGQNTTNATTGFALAPTWGYWRRFSFDFRLSADTAVLEVLAFIFNSSGAGAVGEVSFDGLELRRIMRFEFYEPLLTADALPSISQQRADAFFGAVAVSLGQVSIANGNGHLETLFATYDWSNQEAVIRSGGRFVGDGNETPWEDCPVLAVGLASLPTVEDALVTLELGDVRQRLSQRYPTRYYNREVYPNMAEADLGRPRPLLFGPKTNIRPARTSLTTNGYGVYEVADCSKWAPGIAAVTAVYTYADEDAAGKQDATRRIALSSGGGDYSVALASGVVSILQDPSVIEITYDNQVLDFNIGGAAKVATVTPGLYTPASLCTALQAAMLSAGATAGTTVTYADATHLVTIAAPSGTLNLLCSSGANRSRSAWTEIGFDQSADRTGALTYAGNVSIAIAADGHVIRCDATGYVDDATGTYTGSAGSTIQRAADVTRFILREFARVPAGSIDSVTFASGRTALTQVLGLYLGQPSEGTLELAEILARIEMSVGADVSLEGDVWYFRPRDSSAPSDVVNIIESDLVSWSSGYSDQDYFGVVVVAYDTDPSTGADKLSQLTRSDVDLRFGRPQQETWRTFLTAQPDVNVRKAALSAEAATKRRRFRFEVDGKLLTRRVGQKVQITRSRGLDTSGALSAVLCRILSKDDNLGSWRTSAEVIEVIS